LQNYYEKKEQKRQHELRRLEEQQRRKKMIKIKYNDQCLRRLHTTNEDKQQGGDISKSDITESQNECQSNVKSNKISEKVVIKERIQPSLKQEEDSRERNETKATNESMIKNTLNSVSITNDNTQHHHPRKQKRNPFVFIMQRYRNFRKKREKTHEKQTGEPLQKKRPKKVQK
jgi:hypothetical protein